MDTFLVKLNRCRMIRVRAYSMDQVRDMFVNEDVVKIVFVREK